MNMSWLPLNPDGNPSMTADLAFNTTVSFVSNTNLQHYSGETGVSYLGQLTLMFFQFVSAATGMAACAVVFNGDERKNNRKTWQLLEQLCKIMYKNIIAFINCCCNDTCI